MHASFLVGFVARLVNGNPYQWSYYVTTAQALISTADDLLDKRTLSCTSVAWQI